MTLEEVLKPHEVMAGGLWTKEGVLAAVRWAFEEARFIAHYTTLEVEWDNDFYVGDPKIHRFADDVAKAIQDEAKKVRL